MTMVPTQPHLVEPLPRESNPIPAALADLDPRAALEALVGTVATAVRSANRMPSRVSVRYGDAAIDVEWPEQETVFAPEADSRIEAADGHAGAVAVRAPMVGTFYRKPDPATPPFVEIGDDIAAGQQVAILEAMKLMNPVEATLSGKILEILVEDGESVEYDQPLFLVAPADAP